jgi:hypothetical protein
MFYIGIQDTHDMAKGIGEDIKNFWPFIDRFRPIEKYGRTLIHNQQG